jgi:hypothetical protein
MLFFNYGWVMKPRYRPGKAGTGGKAARAAVAKAKPLSANQMQHIRKEQIVDATASKAGRGGKRADWDIDYEEGIQYDIQPMPYREPESSTIDGVRRWPKKNG